MTTKTCPRCGKRRSVHVVACPCGHDFRAVPKARPALPVAAPVEDRRSKRSRASTESIPEPLADPLRTLRKGLYWLNWANFLGFVILAVWIGVQGDWAKAVSTFGGGIIATLILSGIIRLLPNRPTDIIYLRSFRTDTGTGGIRTSLERALDPEFRVSGIRDPKRRSWRVVRIVLYTLFALRYANPKYLNLEAGDEWRGRLWRSLGEARGVVIDIGDVTDAIQKEIRLCVKCMGLQRILFVVRDSAGPEEWHGRVCDMLGEVVASEDIRLVYWAADGSTRAEFEKQVKQFGRKLPDEPAGFEPAARPYAEALPDQIFEESNRTGWAEVVGGLIIGVVGSLLLRLVAELAPILVFAVVPVVLTLWLILLVQYVSFRWNSGSPARRRIAFWTIGLWIWMLPATAVAVGALLPGVQNLREATARMQSSNNLKQMGLGMENYESTYGFLPAANAPSKTSVDLGKALPVSWRLEVAPFLEADTAFKLYRHDEPWDGPNNIKLLPLMPKTFRHPMAGAETPVGYTHYRVLASKSGVHPSAIFTDGLQTKLKFNTILDGPANTILIVEAEEAVPWTMPEVLPYDRNQPLPKFSPLFRGGFQAALADGSTRMFRKDVPEADLRAWITKDGLEPVTAK